MNGNLRELLKGMTEEEIEQLLAARLGLLDEFDFMAYYITSANGQDYGFVVDPNQIPHWN